VIVVDVAEGGIAGNVAKEVELREGWGRPMEGGEVGGGGDEEGEVFVGGQEGEERMEKEKREEKEAVELVWK